MGHRGAHMGEGREWADEPPGWQQIRQLIERSTPDGHRLVFGIDRHAMLARHDGSDPLARGLAALLLLTLLAWWYVRRTLRPLDAISAGARRFGQGNFDDPIPAAWTRRHGELGELASTLNTMGEDIRQMLDAKRSLLLAISHEMRSPLTRARLHTELLPEDDPEVQPQREALLRDLREMSALVEDLLESERLSDRHVALQRESLDLAVVARGVIAELQTRHPGVQVALHVLPELPAQWLDATRLRLLLRNLLENAVRHGGGGRDSDRKGAHGRTMPDEGGNTTAHTAASLGHTEAPDTDAIAVVHIDRIPTGGCVIEVRDWGPGVPEEQLSKLAEPFHRPDARRVHAMPVVWGWDSICAAWWLRPMAAGLPWRMRIPGCGCEPGCLPIRRRHNEGWCTGAAGQVPGMCWKVVRHSEWGRRPRNGPKGFRAACHAGFRRHSATIGP